MLKPKSTQLHGLFGYFNGIYLNNLSMIIGNAKCLCKIIYLRRLKFSKASEEVESSGLACIENAPVDPMDLFRTWKEEFKMYNPGPESLCLATVSKDCKVSARSVILRKLDEDGFVIVTDNRSRKVNDMDNNRNAAMCFLWTYSNDQQQKIVKQVRIEGEMVRLEKNEYQPLYDREPLYCKIRSKICYQGQQVEWNDLKARHDETLEKVYKKEINLAMPDHFVGYKMLPTMMDFYFARDHLIADRMVYKRLSKESSWTHNRVCA